jgi:hypothetical protein
VAVVAAISTAEGPDMIQSHSDNSSRQCCTPVPTGAIPVMSYDGGMELSDYDFVYVSEGTKRKLQDYVESGRARESPQSFSSTPTGQKPLCENQ